MSAPSTAGWGATPRSRGRERKQKHRPLQSRDWVHGERTDGGRGHGEKRAIPVPRACSLHAQFPVYLNRAFSLPLLLLLPLAPALTHALQLSLSRSRSLSLAFPAGARPLDEGDAAWWERAHLEPGGAKLADHATRTVGEIKVYDTRRPVRSNYPKLLVIPPPGHHTEAYTGGNRQVKLLTFPPPGTLTGLSRGQSSWQEP